MNPAMMITAVLESLGENLDCCQICLMSYKFLRSSSGQWHLIDMESFHCCVSKPIQIGHRTSTLFRKRNWKGCPGCQSFALMGYKSNVNQGLSSAAPFHFCYYRYQARKSDSSLGCSSHSASPAFAPSLLFIITQPLVLNFKRYHKPVQHQDSQNVPPCPPG